MGYQVAESYLLIFPVDGIKHLVSPDFTTSRKSFPYTSPLTHCTIQPNLKLGFKNGNNMKTGEKSPLIQ
jgi:hypothetical protein